MCSSCVSTAEAVVITGAGSIAALQGAARRLADALAGRTPAERAAEAWAANASFARSMGLDPAMVLGPPPEVPTALPVPVALVGADVVGALV